MEAEPFAHAEGEGWSTQQLVEFLASVNGYTDAESAMLGAVEHAAAALDAEIAAVTIGDRIQAAIGFPQGKLPEDDLLAAARGEARAIEVSGLGSCHVSSVPVEAGEGGALLIGRFGDEELSSTEQDLLRGMGRVLALALDSVRLLASLGERQALLERLSRLQRSIASQVELAEVLDAIVRGAAELLGDETAGLRLVRPDDPGQLELVSAAGLDDETIEKLRYSPVGDGVGGRAVATGELVVAERYGDADYDFKFLAKGGLAAAMAAPIFERDRVAGSLVVATSDPTRTYSPSEREALTMFAEHAGLALNDARATEETMHQAFHDSLTGLPNRAQFLDRLEELLDGEEGRAAVLFVDLDGFKTVNDSLGHQAGDELLAQVARRLTDRIGERAMVARFGGDEFAILIEHCSEPSVARREAQALLEHFESPFEIRGREVKITASIGISAGETQADHVLRNADLAMYQAKSRGKGRSESFEPGMHTAVVERLELEADLNRAIDREEILLHFQPVCGLRGGRIVGLEALARWDHPVRGLIPPADFIPLAEESRQILSLGRRILREACRQAAVWQARYQCDPPLRMSVNLSGVQLEQPTIVEDVRTALERADLDPGSLMLEMTETALMADSESSIRKLRELKDLGVMLGVDDFGTGYSSLDYLRRFPIDVLKIAKSFVDDIVADEREAPLVRAIIDLAHSFDLTVIAEGIEHAEQREALVELGCEMGQGFLFARPVDAADTNSMLFAAAALSESAHRPGRLKLPVPSAD